MKKNKTFYYLSWLTIASALVLLFTVFYWWFCPYEPIIFNQNPLIVTTKEVKRGDHVNYLIDYCKKSDVQPEVTITFNDGIIYIIPKGLAVFRGKGCYKSNIQVLVPEALPEGIFTMTINYRYKVNPIRTVIASVETEQFTVK